MEYLIVNYYNPAHPLCRGGGGDPICGRYHHCAPPSREIVITAVHWMIENRTLWCVYIQAFAREGSTVILKKSWGFLGRLDDDLPTF